MPDQVLMSKIANALIEDAEASISDIRPGASLPSYPGHHSPQQPFPRRAST
jgi:hypothetical protein